MKKKRYYKKDEPSFLFTFLLIIIVLSIFFNLYVNMFLAIRFEMFSSLKTTIIEFFNHLKSVL